MANGANINVPSNAKEIMKFFFMIYDPQLGIGNPEDTPVASFAA